MTPDEFVRRLTSAITEEEVITVYTRLLGARQWSRPFGSDGLHDDTLFEFKHDLKLDSLDGFRVIAQGCYYLRKLWRIGVYKGTRYTLPKRLAICDRNEAVVLAVNELEPIFTSDKFDWDRAASSPDPAITAEVRRIIKRPVVFSVTDTAQVSAWLDALQSVGSTIRCEITRHNFLKIFEVWRGLFDMTGCPEQDVASAFLTDLTGAGAFVDTEAGQIIFKRDKHTVQLRVLVESYQQFWLAYRRPPTDEEMRALQERKDQLIAIQHRRVTGEFFTPLDIAELAHQYLLTADDKAYDRPFWDLCAGTGNLTFHVPASTQLFISTLHSQDLDTIRACGQNPGAELFQFDFLNDPWEKLPKTLEKALWAKEGLTVLINPPFAAGTGGIQGHKANVSATKTADAMDGLSHAVQNTYTQFMFRLLELAERYGIEIVLGMFSKAIFATGPGYEKFRQLWARHCAPLGGFVFHAKEFEGTKGKWPVAYHIWRIQHKQA